MGKEVIHSARKEALLAQSPFLRAMLSPDRALQTPMDDFLEANKHIDNSIAQSYNVNWTVTLGEPIFIQAVLHKMFLPHTTLEQGLVPIVGLIKIGYELESYTDISALYSEINAFAKKNRMFDPQQQNINKNYIIEYTRQIMSITYFGTTLKMQHIKQGLLLSENQEPIERSIFSDFIDTLDLDGF